MSPTVRNRVIDAADLVQEEKHALGLQAGRLGDAGDFEGRIAYLVAAQALQRVEDKLRAAAEPEAKAERYVNSYEGACLSCGHEAAHDRHLGAGCTFVGCRCPAPETRAKYLTGPQCETCGGSRWLPAPEAMKPELPTPCLKKCPACNGAP